MKKWLVSSIFLFLTHAHAADVRVWLQDGSDSQWLGAQDILIQSADGSLSERLSGRDSNGSEFYLPLADLAFIQADNKYFYVSDQYVAVTKSGKKIQLPAAEAEHLFVVRNNFGGYTSFDYSALRRIIFE